MQKLLVTSGSLLLLGVLIFGGASIASAQVTGSGTVNQLVKFTGISTIGNSSLLSETNNGIGIGIAVPHGRLDVIADAGGNAIQVRNAKMGIANIMDVDGAGDGRTRWRTAKGLEKVNILAHGITYFNGGNVGIGTSQPSSLLDVAGLAKFLKAQTGSLKINGGEEITGHLSATASLDFGTVAPNTCAEQSVSVAGASAGDTVNVGPLSAPSATSVWSAYAVTDTVTVRLCNVGTSPVAVDTSSWRADVWKHGSVAPVSAI